MHCSKGSYEKTNEAYVFACTLHTVQLFAIESTSFARKV
jgi:hypothetical protein